MSNYGEHNFLLFTLVFLLTFFLLVTMIPPMFLNAGSYEGIFPKTLESFTLTRGNFHICDNVTIPVGALNYFLNVVWTNGTNHIGYGFGSFYPFIAFWLAPIVDRDYILNYNASGQVVLTLKDANSTVFVDSLITYNHTLYSSLIAAFDAGSLLVYIGGLTVTSPAFPLGAYSSSGWLTGLALIGQLLFFSAPNIDPVLNAIIAIPVWTAIGICIIIIWSKIKF